MGIVLGVALWSFFEAGGIPLAAGRERSPQILEAEINGNTTFVSVKANGTESS